MEAYHRLDSGHMGRNLDSLLWGGWLFILDTEVWRACATGTQRDACAKTGTGNNGLGVYTGSNTYPHEYAQTHRHANADEDPSAD